jgi:hypothetical protein
MHCYIRLLRDEVVHWLIEQNYYCYLLPLGNIEAYFLRTAFNESKHLSIPGYPLPPLSVFVLF